MEILSSVRDAFYQLKNNIIGWFQSLKNEEIFNDDKDQPEPSGNQRKPSITSKEFKIFKSANECVVCWDNKANIIFQPCGHIVLCLDCQKGLLKCPVCRATRKGGKKFAGKYWVYEEIPNGDENLNDEPLIGRTDADGEDQTQPTHNLRSRKRRE